MSRAKKTLIHINQHIIRANKATGSMDPVITCKQGSKNTYAMEAEILGPCKVVYSPDKPLSCGARVWIETEAEVRLKDPVSSKDFKALQKKACDL